MSFNSLSQPKRMCEYIWETESVHRPQTQASSTQFLHAHQAQYLRKRLENVRCQLKRLFVYSEASAVQWTNIPILMSE